MSETTLTTLLLTMAKNGQAWRGNKEWVVDADTFDVIRAEVNGKTQPLTMPPWPEVGLMSYTLVGVPVVVTPPDVPTLLLRDRT